MNLRQRLAIAVAKAASALSKMAGKQGQNLPGTVGLRLAPGLLRDLAAQVRQHTILVTGTNGKTTLNNVLADLLEQNNYQVIANRSGANQRSGIAGSFILAAQAGRIDCDIACLESDEAWTRHSIVDLPADLLIITNLFRDQLDRFGEIDTTMQLLLEAIAQKPDLKLLVNGDDPLCVALAIRSGREFKSFGVVDCQSADAQAAREAIYCPQCGAKLDYACYHYAQLGHYHCECGFSRPEIDYKISEVEVSDQLDFVVNGQTYTAAYRGFYNVYNLAAVIAVFEYFDLRRTMLHQQLAELRPSAGRNQVFTIGETEVILNLAKNPAGFNQNLQDMLRDPELSHVAIGINDREQDGRDVSWLWDVDFEQLHTTGAEKIMTAGLRGRDMALRLKYDNLSSQYVESMAQAIDQLLAERPKKLYILVNYTLLASTHQYLKQLVRRNPCA